MKIVKVSALQALLAMCLIGASSPSVYSQTDQNKPMGTMPLQSMLSDTSFVRKNIMDNRMEINLSQMALKRSTNSQVTSVAQQMVSDHTAMLNDLQSFATANNMNIGTWNNPPMNNMGNDPTLKNGGQNNNGVINGNGNGTPVNGSNNGSSTSGSTNQITTSGNGSTTRSTSVTGNGSSTSGTTNQTTTSGNGSTTRSTSVTGNGSSTNGSTNRSTMENRKDSSTNSRTTRSTNVTASGSPTNGGTISSTNSNGNPTINGNSNNGTINSDHNSVYHDGSALSNLQGQQFDDAWVSQMLTMHQNKLNELTQANQSVQDPQLKASIAKAIPMIRTHIDALAQINAMGNK